MKNISEKSIEFCVDNKKERNGGLRGRVEIEGGEEEEEERGCVWWRVASYGLENEGVNNKQGIGMLSSRFFPSAPMNASLGFCISPLFGVYPP